MDSWDEALDELEALLEVKAEEKVGAKQDLIEIGVFKPLVKEEKLEEELNAKDWKQMGANEPLVDPGEAAEVVEEFAKKDKVEENDAKQDLIEIGAKQDLLEIGAKQDLEVICAAEDEVEEEKLAKDKVEKHRISEGNLEEGIGANKPLVDPGEVAKAKLEICEIKGKEVNFANKPLLDPGEAVEVVATCIASEPLVDPGEPAEVEVVETCVAKDKVEEICIGKVKVEEFASKGKVWRSGGLDPGEDAAKGTEEKQELSEVLRGARLKLLVFPFCDAKFELQVSRLLRFVTAGCLTQSANSEYG